MAIVPGMVITAPEPGRRRYGLFDAAAGPLALPAHGQGGGVRYVPNGCGQAYAYPVNCEADPPDKPIDTDNEIVDSGVFAVLATLNCAPVGYTPAEQEAKVLRRLEGAEQAAVERALWGGLDLEGNPLEILNLDESAVDIGGSYDSDSISDVVGALERYAYAVQGYGYPAVLHAPVEVAAIAFQAGIVLQDGPRKVTPMGTAWSFGAYESGSVWITGQTTVWRSEIQVASGLDQATNQMLLLAERTYAVAFDCFAGVASFDPLEVTSP
jgi:hypothetical protein